MSLLELFCDYNKYYHIQTSFPETLSIRLLMATISMSPTVPHNNLSEIEKKKKTYQIFIQHTSCNPLKEEEFTC